MSEKSRSRLHGKPDASDPVPVVDIFHPISVDECPDGPHRTPEGPNEDLAQCPMCLWPSWELRPVGETYGWHLPDCSLPERHESFCQPGGSGHPPAPHIRGYWPEGQHLHTAEECCYRHGHHVMPHQGCPLR